MKNATAKKRTIPSHTDTEELKIRLVADSSEIQPTIGDKIRAMREKQGYSRQEIADLLRISERFLTAIEEMDITNLPERVYTLGFIRSYTRYLNLDSQQAVDQFKKEVYEDHEIDTLSLPEPVADMSRANGPILVVCTVIIGLIIFCWYQLSYKDHIQKIPQPVVTIEPTVVQQVKEPVEELPVLSPKAPFEELVKEQKDIPIETVEPTPQPAVQPSNDPPSITLRFTDKAWVTIKKNNARVIAKNFNVGESYSFPLDAETYIDTTNAGNVLIELSGKKYNLGQKDHKLDHFKLTKESIEQLALQE